MPIQTPITFVVATPTNRRDLLEDNLLASPCFRKPHPHQIIVQVDYPSATKAYNDAIHKSENDLIVFVHLDIILPEQWLPDLGRALDWLDEEDPEWGVIGCYGETRDDGGRGYVYSTGLDIIGRRFDHPARIQTLDEIVLILRKSSGLQFDESLPNFHMYGTDICLAAAEAGRKSYAISAFCIHNTQPSLILGEDFYQCYRWAKRKWKKYCPIQTSCIRITRYNGWMYMRRLREMYHRYIRPKEFGGNRAADVQRLLCEVDALVNCESAARPISTELRREAKA